MIYQTVLLAIIFALATADTTEQASELFSEPVTESFESDSSKEATELFSEPVTESFASETSVEASELFSEPVTESLESESSVEVSTATEMEVTPNPDLGCRFCVHLLQLSKDYLSPCYLRQIGYSLSDICRLYPWRSLCPSYVTNLRKLLLQLRDAIHPREFCEKVGICYEGSVVTELSTEELLPACNVFLEEYTSDELRSTILYQLAELSRQACSSFSTYQDECTEALNAKLKFDLLYSNNNTATEFCSLFTLEE